MKEITDSVVEAIRKRTASATLGTYLFFWLSYHWQGVYTTLFVDQNFIYKQHGLLKNEYVDRYFFGINGPFDWTFYLGFIVPAALTYLFIWWMPKVLLLAYQQEQKFKVSKRIIRIEQEKRVQVDRTKLAKVTNNAIREEAKTTQARKKAAITDPRILWEDELRSLDPLEMGLFKEILKSVYERRGNVVVYSQFSDMGPEFELSANALRFADSRELITIVDKGARIELNAKGKYFASKFKEML